MPNNSLNSIVPGRTCGACSLCCKVFPIAVVEKAAGEWCRHCRPGSGCVIWADRPRECQDFFCNWMMDPTLPDEWRPDRARFVLTYSLDGRNLIVTADQGHPDHWRKEPFGLALRRFALELLKSNRCIIVHARGRKLVMLPDREVELGPIETAPPFAIARADAAGGGSVWKVKVGDKLL